MVFSGMSGSATADTSALGAVLIPAMKRQGYPAPFAAAMTVAPALVGPMIPPSVTLVVYGTLANVSIGRLLIAGIAPGFVIILSQMVFTYFLARNEGYPRASVGEIALSVKRGGPALSVSGNHCRRHPSGYLFANRGRRRRRSLRSDSGPVVSASDTPQAGLHSRLGMD